MRCSEELQDWDCDRPLKELRACPLPQPMKFKNEHISVSRAKMYDQCPASFEMRYIKKLPILEESIPPLFGKLLHAVLEDLFRWVMNEEFSGPLPESTTVEFYRQQWTSAGLSGAELYNEGISILRSYIAKHPPIDHLDLIGIEEPFELQLDEFRVVGRMDRVDRVDEQTVRIVDFKSNRLLFTDDEVSNDVQMSIYGLAAKQLWPWAKRVEYAFHMLRHDVVTFTSRTEVQLSDASDYIVAIGRMTESGQKYPAKLNPNCGYCDYRKHCAAYQEALAGKVEKVAITKGDLESVAKAREQAHSLGKLFYRRKEELDDILRVHLEHQSELRLPGAGVTYKLIPTNNRAFPASRVVNLIAKYANVPKEEVERKVLSVAIGKLDAYLDSLEKEGLVPASRMRILRAEIDVSATIEPGKAKLQSSKVGFSKTSKGDRVLETKETGKLP